MSFVILNSDDYTLHFSETFASIFEAANACAEHVQEAPHEYGPHVELLIVKFDTLKKHHEELDQLLDVAEGKILIQRRGWLTINIDGKPVSMSIPKKTYKKPLKKRQKIVVWNIEQKRKFCLDAFSSMDKAANVLGRALKATPNHNEHERFGLFKEEDTVPAENKDKDFAPHESLARAIVEVVTRCWLSLKADTYRQKIMLPLAPSTIKKITKKLNTAD